MKIISKFGEKANADELGLKLKIKGLKHIYVFYVFFCVAVWKGIISWRTQDECVHLCKHLSLSLSIHPRLLQWFLQSIRTSVQWLRSNF